jgi:hypothetical protein
MSRTFRVLFGVSLFLLTLLSLTAAYAPFTNTCYVTGSASGCGIGDVGIFSILDWTPNSSHITPYFNSSYYYHMCCNFNATMTPGLSLGYCGQGSFISAFATSNSHLAQNRTGGTGATYNLCVASGDGYAYCTYRYGNASCVSPETAIGSIDSLFPGNSHLGWYGSMGINICCSFNTTIQLPGVNIAGFEYWCGASDGVCPERFSNSTGGQVSCYLRPDPDC